MIRKLTVLSLALALTLAAPLFAGKKKHGYKCDAEATTCLAKMGEKFASRGWVGIEYDNDETTGTMKIERVVPDSPAYKAKLRVGDVLLAVNGVSFASDDKARLKKATKEWSAGTTVTYTVRRGSSEMPIYVTLGNIPKDVMAQWVGKHMVEHHMPTQIAKY